MKRNRLLKLYAIPMVLLIAAGCSNSAPKAENQPNASTTPTPHDPVTLTIYLQAAVSDEDFQLLFADPVKKKYPYITLKAVHPADGSRIDDLISAGQTPDLITAPDGDILGFNRQDLLFDITPLVKKQNIDLNRFEPAAIQAASSDKGELWALPYGMEFNSLYYNKDIFDKFGVSYPKDGMTWDDAVQLAKAVTRKDQDVQYRGLDVVNSNLMSYPFALSYVDAKTNKAAINSEKWKEVFELTKLIQTIPGNEPPKPEPSTSTVAEYFIKDKNLAMAVAPSMLKYFSDSDGAGVNWDFAQYPSYKELPNISGKVDSHTLIITKTSPHKDDAVKVLEVLTSDEVQLLNVRKTGRVSPLKNPEMHKQFGLDIPYLKGKHTDSIFKSTVVAPPKYSDNESDARKIGKQKYTDYLSGKIDSVTALRQGEDEINKMLASKK